MSKYTKLEDVIHAIAENMAQAANLKEHCNEPTFCAGEFLVEAEMLVKNLPTIEVSEDCIDRYSASYTNGLEDAYTQRLFNIRHGIANNLVFQLPIGESDEE